jgi:glycine/D-amino acid oxidase-like deaminating enzyme
MRETDVLIIGQGIAGTCLAWQLYFRNIPFMIIDREEQWTSSKAAAGLMTPITGKRLVKAPEWDEYWPYAVAFHQKVEQQLGQSFFTQRPMVRFFKSDEEQQLFARKAPVSYPDMVREPVPPVHDPGIIPQFGSFEMPVAGQLEVGKLIAATRDFFMQRQQVITADVKLQSDIQLLHERVKWNGIAETIEARRLIFAEGYHGGINPFFPQAQQIPAKGEILTVRIPELQETRIMHHGLWVVPMGEGICKVGSTYDWNHLDCEPTEQGRREIIERLENLIRYPYEVIDHYAAVRPTPRRFLPHCMQHVEHPQLGLLNGLGSKGSLLAPIMSQQLLDKLFTTTLLT